MASFVQNVFRLNSIKGNIILGLFVMGFFTLLVTASTTWFSSRLEEQQQQYSEALVPTVMALKGIDAGISQAALALDAYLETGKDLHRKEWEEIWTSSLLPHQEFLASDSSHTVSDISITKKIQSLNKQVQGIYTQQHEVVNSLQKYYVLEGNAASSAHEAGNDFKTPYRYTLKNTQLQLIKEATASSQMIQTQLNQLLERQQAQQHDFFTLAKTTGIVIFVLCVLGGITIGYYLVAQIMRSLYQIKLAVKELSQGNLPEIVRQSKNETSHITKELSNLTKNLHNVKQFALQVGNGQFDNEINVFNNSGELGSSLAGMRDSLARVAQEDQQRNWVNEGFALFGDILRNQDSIATLCDSITTSLVKYVGANQGAIFLVKHSDQEGAEVLYMASCYAYERKKFQQKEILKGEGLCGQAWQEGDLILINDVPQNYVNIRSGLGGTTPSAVLVVPLMMNETVQGVLELASFTEFKPYQVEFIKKIAENMASSIATARNNEKTHQLLSEFQEVTEQMRAQEEEMRQNMEELQATQEEMERAQSEIERKEQNLNSVINNTSDTIFAIDREYKITVANKVITDKYKLMGISLEVGTCIKDILPRSAWEKWQKRYDRALAGEQYSVVEESSGSNGKRYSQTYHNPILDDAGQVIGVSVVSRDVTDTVSAQMEAERKRSTLSSLIDNTDDTYFAIDRDYKILIANKTLKDRFAASNITLEEGDYIFDKLPKDQHVSWKERYDKALAGESFVVTNERQVKDKTLTIEVHHHPILDAEGTVIGATVISKDITRWQQVLLDKEAQQREIQQLRQIVGIQDAAKAQVLKNAAQTRKSEKA